MPSKLAKVQKHVAKKKGDKAKSLHEHSRDAQRLRRAGAKDDKVARMTAVREKSNKIWLDRVKFIREALPDTLHPLQTEEILALIAQYLKRHDEELAQLRSERRPGRPPSTRQVLLEQQIEMDGKEADSGYWLPNLKDEQTLVKLDTWSGDWAALGTMRFMRIDGKGNETESAFPPRGAA
jgi:translation machinery-associated protein 16